MTEAPGVGIVVIARNEGDRLRRCLESVAGRAGRVVYVDSGSTDGSPDLARSLGADVVDLDLSVPFTAARARNRGFERLAEIGPDLEYVQFVDGDCEVAPGWIAEASAALRREPGRAIVCGRVRERDRGRTIYNRLADMEWDGPTGEVRACGGIFMVRAAAFRAVGGFDRAIIAGEEPELCVRLRAAGWGILRLDAEMALHDLDMTRFSQWWRRAVRSGHAYAEGAALHGAPPERHWVRESRSNWFWGLVVPAGGLALAWPTGGLSLLVVAAGYALVAWRGSRWGMARGWDRADSWLFGASCALAKIPMALGQIRYTANRARGRRPTLIEYKGAGAAPPGA